MKHQDKVNYLANNHSGEWLRTRPIAEDELSGKQTIICVCGRLATGFHESSCRKFQKEVDKRTVVKLDDLLKKIT